MLARVTLATRSMTSLQVRGGLVDAFLSEMVMLLEKVTEGR